MDPSIATLVGELLASGTFEEAATATLGALLRTAQGALASSAYASRGRIVRGMVHLRPGDGYRRLAILEHRLEGEAALEKPPSLTAYLPSSTAWRAVVEHRAPVSIDVSLGSLRAHGKDGVLYVDPGGPSVGGFESQESRQRLLGRAATHVFAIPLRGPAQGAFGMITIEADCRAAMGTEFVWTEAGAGLQLLTDVAAPYLTGLPLRPAAAGPSDELLPVIGPSMAALVEMLRFFAQQEETLLLSGPTGAGKSRLARWCHQQSPRSAKRFESLDLSAVPEELQLGELFGWRKGAFTGAVKDNPGAMARAEGGTLFIDEIDKLSLKSQAGLLHLLEERTYRVLGDGAADRVADVRFVIGTNADLKKEVSAGRFREDLYYRIEVLPLRVPALDERRDEIGSWAGYMARRRHREGGGTGDASVADEAADLLAARSWPGNLRQLDNIVRRAYALAVLGRGGAAGDVVIGAPQFARALEYEGGEVSVPVLDLMQRAASAFVVEAERLAAEGRTLDLDLAEAFRGFVLGAAARRLGKEETFRLLGKESLLQSRNHHKTLRRELERALELCGALGSTDTFPYAALLEGKDGK